MEGSEEKDAAIKVMISLANQGNAFAQHDLAVYYEHGIGLEKI